MPPGELKYFSFVKTESLNPTEVSGSTVTELSYTRVQSHAV